MTKKETATEKATTNKDNFVVSILKNVFKSPAPLPVKIIAWYFLLDGFANIIEEIVHYGLQFDRPFLHDFRFLYTTLPGITSNDPFTHGIIAIPLYDPISGFLKSLAIISILLFAGYKLLKMEKLGWLLGIFIAAFGLLVSVVLSNPIDYLGNIFGGIAIYGVMSEWTIMSIAFLINVFALIYLPTHRKLFKTTQVNSSKNKLPKKIIILVALVTVGIVGFAYYFQLRKDQATATQVYVLEPPISSDMRYVNFWDKSDGSPSYFSGQIVTPIEYYATTDNMLTNFDTQGGSAQPIVVLMKNHQVLDGNQVKYYEQIAPNPNNDCIIVWSTNKSSSIEDWNDTKLEKGKLTDKQDFSVGTRKATVYKLDSDNVNIYVGLLLIGGNEDASYYFNTCNTNNKSDFINVIKSLKLRKDVNFQ